MAIKATTDCEKCAHKEVCMYGNYVKGDMQKLSGIRYGKGPNDDFGWGDISTIHGYDIIFSCPRFMTAGRLAIGGGRHA